MKVAQRPLAVKLLPHPHTSVNIRAACMDVLREYGINEKNVVRIVGDNAANVRGSFTEEKVLSVQIDGRRDPSLTFRGTFKMQMTI